MLNCDRGCSTSVLFLMLAQYLLIKHASKVIDILFLVVRIGMGIYLRAIQRSFIFDKNLFLCGHLSAKPGLLLSSKHDSKWNFQSSVIRTTRWGSAGASLHPCHTPSVCTVTPLLNHQLYTCKNSSRICISSWPSVTLPLSYNKGKVIPFALLPHPLILLIPATQVEKHPTFQNARMQDIPEMSPSAFTCSWDMSHFGCKVSCQDCLGRQHGDMAGKFSSLGHTGMVQSSWLLYTNQAQEAMKNYFIPVAKKFT